LHGRTHKSGSLDVRFPQKTTKLLRGSEMTRSANSPRRYFSTGKALGTGELYQLATIHLDRFKVRALSADALSPMASPLNLKTVLVNLGIREQRSTLLLVSLQG
jgi:hypothetical protein